MDLPQSAPAEDVVSDVVDLPRPVPTVLAVGAFLKNTLCLVDGDRALVSRDVGNLDTADAVLAFEVAAERLLAIADPDFVAHDRHPEAIQSLGQVWRAEMAQLLPEFAESITDTSAQRPAQDCETVRQRLYESVARFLELLCSGPASAQSALSSQSAEPSP